ncbi:MAG: HDIG domain-containing metalloprotein [Gemmatimonadaceae bacterium]
MGVRELTTPFVQDDEPAGRADRLLYHLARVAPLGVVAAITYLLFPAAPAVDSPLYEVGSVATQSVIAPFAFDVPKGGAELQREREELSRSAQPIFFYLPTAVDSALKQLRGFTDAVGVAARETPAAPAIVKAAAARGVVLSTLEADYLAFPGRRQAMDAGVRRVFQRWLPAGIMPSTGLEGVRGDVIVRRGSEEHSEHADSLLSFGSLLARARAMHPDPNSSAGDGVFIKLVSAFFHPSILADRAATDVRRAELARSVSPIRYQVRAGEKIVGEHEVVQRAEFDKLRALHDAMQTRSRGERAAGRITGTILYNALVLAMFGVAIALFRPQLYKNVRALWVFAFLFLLVLGAASLAARVTPIVYSELVPVALAAIILSILFDPRISMIAAMILAVLVGGQGLYRGTNATFMNLVAGAATALSVRVIRRRDQAYYSILTVAMAYAFAAIAIGLTLSWTPTEIGTSMARGAGNALVSVSLALILLPLVERFTGITTDLTLLEYSDLNRPLLRRLSMEAPGTFQHTLVIANLAESACNAIGANGLLARVGAYYHDIGKLERPHYFVENQTRGRNPHDTLAPDASASIIRNHITEGIALARANRLPPPIIAFIAEHHGTGAITYFLERAREREGAVPNTQEFEYPGPVPQTAETAVVMLADGIEAATRVLNDPTPRKVRDVIDHIVAQRITQGQLRDAPLTLRQLDVVKEQFARTLSGMTHGRISYPASSGGITAEFVSPSRS